MRIKERIILIGSGQHANVVLYNVKAQNKYDVIGMLDSDSSKINKNINGVKVLGNYEDTDCLDYIKKKLDVNKFFIGFGNMNCRKKAYEHMIENGWGSINIIHPNAIVSDITVLGNGVLIECGCLITPNPIIGNNVVINTGSQVNHDNVIGNHTYIASGVVLSGGVVIGENSLIDDGVIVSLGKKVGNNCIVGAGSVVTKDISDNSISYGNPAKYIRGNLI